jgi:hypothetical protein
MLLLQEGHESEESKSSNKKKLFSTYWKAMNRKEFHVAFLKLKYLRTMEN